jgi:D-alanine-D-alanine ligase
MKYVPAKDAQAIDSASKVWLPSYLAAAGIPCTGSGAEAYALELDKTLAKDRVRSSGLATADYVVINKYDDFDGVVDLDFPLFVKPTNRRGGQGIDAFSLVHNREQLVEKVKAVCGAMGADALIEEYLPGREFSVAILKQIDSDEYSVMPIELIPPLNQAGVRVLCRQVKNDNEELAVRVSDSSLYDAVCELGLKAFKALGADGYGRIDIRLDKQQNPFFLEANLTPSVTQNYGSFPKACLINESLDYDDMILRIVSVALAASICNVATTVPVSS